MKQPDYKKNIAVIIKVGDNGKYRHLQPISYIDYDDWGGSPAELSDNMGKVFGIIEVPRAYKGIVQDIIDMNVQYSEDSNFRYLIKESFVGLEKIDAWLGQEVVAPVQADGAWVFESKDVGDISVKDFNAISQGTYTVGSGGDYANFVAVSADTTNMTGDFLFRQISDTTEVAQVQDALLGNGFDYVITNTLPHYGDPTAGYKVYFNHTGTRGFNINVVSASSMVKIEYLHMINSNSVDYMVEIGNGSSEYQISNCLIDGASDSSRGIYFPSGTTNIFLFNNVVWDCVNWGYLFTGGGSGSIIENNVAYSSGIGFFLNFTATARNNASFDNTTDYSNIANITGYNNASEDATAADANWAGGSSGNLHNFLVAGAWQGVNPANADFFDIVAEGILDGAGVANAIADRTKCIRNRDVPGPNGTSIGVAEAPTPEPPEEVASVDQSHISIAISAGIHFLPDII